LFTSSLALVCFHILVFHLKQKHEEWQRFLHYLQQSNTYFSDVKLFLCVRNEEFYTNATKGVKLCVFREIEFYRIAWIIWCRNFVMYCRTLYNFDIYIRIVSLESILLNLVPFHCYNKWEELSICKHDRSCEKVEFVCISS
jgi:hypothetical protein